MRDVNRIEPFVQEMAAQWKNRFPDWRFGQLMFNFFSEIGDPFYLEEDEFMVAFQAFCNGEVPKNAIHKFICEKLEKSR